MMSGHLSSILQATINRLIANPPDIHTALEQAFELGIQETEAAELMAVLREAFSQRAGVFKGDYGQKNTFIASEPAASTTTRAHTITNKRGRYSIRCQCLAGTSASSAVSTEVAHGTNNIDAG
jgi:hypothetical protein